MSHLVIIHQSIPANHGRYEKPVDFANHASFDGRVNRMTVIPNNGYRNVLILFQRTVVLEAGSGFGRWVCRINDRSIITGSWALQFLRWENVDRLHIEGRDWLLVSCQDELEW